MQNANNTELYIVDLLKFIVMSTKEYSYIQPDIDDTKIYRDSNLSFSKLLQKKHL